MRWGCILVVRACLFFPDGTRRPNYGSPNMTVSLAQLSQEDYIRYKWIQDLINTYQSKATSLFKTLVQSKFFDYWNHLLLVWFSTAFRYIQPTIPLYSHSGITVWTEYAFASQQIMSSPRKEDANNLGGTKTSTDGHATKIGNGKMPIGTIVSD